MALHNFNAAYGLVDSLYGITLSEGEFEDIALNGWEKIGNRHTRLYRFIGDVVDGKLKLPCNVSGPIESVHVPMPDAQLTSNKSDLNFIDSLWTEGYIDFWKWNEDPYYTKGKLIKYDEGDGVLYFSKDYHNVMVVYHGILADETGLPLLNDKELNAVAAYVAYMSLFKEGIRKRDGNIINLAQTLKVDWLQLCNAARIPEQFSQNDMDRILDAKASWDRKQYGKSLKPIR